VDLVEHGVTGFLARPFDVEELANYIRILLTDAEQASRVAKSAREQAVRRWSPREIAGRHLDLYTDVRDRRDRHPHA
jgi:glycosyltransferase involved in cell wall biosynthesis